MQELLGNLGIDWRLLIAQAINFLLVLWLLNKFVFKKLVHFLEERKNKIEKGLELTEKAEREMERINEARQREIKNAKEEAEKILSDSRSSAAEKEKAVITLARQESEKITQKAKEEADRERKDAILGAKEEVKKLAVFMAEKLLSRTVNEKDQEKAAEEVMEYFEKQHAGAK